jgi:hypothetical protein
MLVKEQMELLQMKMRKQVKCGGAHLCNSKKYPM